MSLFMHYDLLTLATQALLRPLQGFLAASPTTNTHQPHHFSPTSSSFTQCNTSNTFQDFPTADQSFPNVPYGHPSGPDFGQEVFGAGVGLMLAASLLKYFQRKSMDVYHRFQSSSVSDVVLYSDDEVYQHVAEFLAAHPEMLSREWDWLTRITWYALVVKVWILWPFGLGALAAGQLKSLKGAQSKPSSMICKVSYNNSKDDEDGYYYRRRYEEANKKPALIYVPNAGSYVITFQGQKLRLLVDIEAEGSPLERKPEDGTGDSGGTVSLLKRSKLVIVANERDGTRIKEFIQAAVDEFFQKSKGLTNIFLMNQWHDTWVKACQRAPRRLETIILKQGQIEDIMKDIKRFQSSETWYKNLGIPYRRGYILHGPPGSGKSSLIAAIAGQLQLNLCLLTLSNSKLSDRELANAVVSSPQNSILVLEDIDVAFSVDKNRKQSGCKITLSGLLNVLDGLISQEGRLVFMTTNNLAALPPSLLRPGRCDRRYFLDYADADMVKRLYIRFFEPLLPTPEEAAEIGERVATKLTTCAKGKLGCAQLQGYFMRCSDDPHAAETGVDNFLKELEVQRKEDEEYLKREEEMLADKKTLRDGDDDE
ncbi:mitochondrial chaperone [Chytridiales sp. JEL 0842]|nr:mitochondrial chaperone [Chytridiales sp. JEL 0842]